MIKLAHIILGNRAAAEDVVQDAFCGLYRRWAHLANKDKAVSYVRTSVLNGCRSVLRQHRLGELTDQYQPVTVSAEAAVLSAEERQELSGRCAGCRTGSATFLCSGTTSTSPMSRLPVILG